VSALLIDPANSAKLYFSDQFGTGVFKSIRAARRRQRRRGKGSADNIRGLVAGLGAFG
jgi:hypothetical protein